MPKAPLIELLHLPVPGQTLREDREIKVEEFAICPKATIPVLKARLSAYNCPISGSRPQLIQRLREFALDRDNWASIFQSHIKRRRGDISGSRANKLSSQRIIAQFGEQHGPTEHRSKRGMERAPQPLREFEIGNNTSWAEAVLTYNWARNGNVGMSSEGPTITDRPLSPLQSVLGKVQPEIPVVNGSDMQTPGDKYDPCSLRLRRVERSIVSFKHDISNRIDCLESYLRSHFPNTAPDSEHLITPSPSMVLQTVSHTAADLHLHPALADSIANISCPSDQTVTLVAAEINPKNLAIIKLGDEEFACDRTQISDPPAKHFSNNISELFQQWHQSEYLVVNGRGIPIKYWPEFYQAKKGFKSGAWKAIRVEWGNWKFIVEEREKHASEALFWAKFSSKESGKQFGFQQILTALKHERTARDAQCAADAKQFFHGNLGHADAKGAFNYTLKAGNSVVMTKTGDIARNWRNLLAQDTSIAALWSAQQAETAELTDDFLDG